MNCRRLSVLPPKAPAPSSQKYSKHADCKLQPMYADFLDPGTCLHRLVVSFWAPACPKHREYSGCNRRTRIFVDPGTCLQGWAGPRDLLCHVWLYHVFVICLVGCHLICGVASVSNAWWPELVEGLLLTSRCCDVGSCNNC